MAFITEPTGYEKTAISDLQGSWGNLREAILASRAEKRSAFRHFAVSPYLLITFGLPVSNPNAKYLAQFLGYTPNSTVKK